MDRKRGQHRGPSTAGLTLIEVLVATGLLVLGLTTFLTALSGIRRVSVAADRRMAAMHRAREVLESVLTQQYSASALSVGSHALSDASYTVSRNTSFAATKDIVVTVPWEDPRGNASQDVVIYGSIASCMH